SGPLGALVVQRAEGPFDEHDAELLAALGAIVSAGMRHAEIIDARRDKPLARRAGGGTRKVTLTGRPFVGGRALGAIAALRRPAARLEAPEERDPKDRERLLRGAFDVADKAIRAIALRAKKMSLGE